MNGKIYTIDAFVKNQVTNYFHIQCQQHTPPFDDSVWDYQGGPVPEETITQKILIIVFAGGGPMLHAMQGRSH